MFKLYYSRENKKNYNYIAFTDIEGNDADEESHSINFYQCRISKKIILLLILICKTYKKLEDSTSIK